MEMEIENPHNSFPTKHDDDDDDDQESMEKLLVNSNTKSVSLNSDNAIATTSEMSYQDEGDHNDDDCDISDCNDDDEDDDDDDEYLYDNDYDDYLSMQAQFDNVDLPPGVEASFSWMQDKAKSNPNTVDASSQAGLASCKAPSASSVPAHFNTKNETSASTSSIGKEQEEDVDDILRKYRSFKQFDVVNDHSDHQYSVSGFQGQQPSRAWTKKIQDEWKILEKDLPDTIYIRVYESRMDLLRAIIVGPQGTPYHDGLFVFDVLFPPTYPDVPPMVYYHSGGLRLNPNLYNCGKVCLSLLNTWSGRGTEKWVPQSSTMLQVVVSIQALILNAKPFFNEPGYETRFVGQQGENKSKAYNEEVFILSLKTMMYNLRRPPKHYEDLVAGHFRFCAHDILLACRAYMEGALVGSLVNGKVPDGTRPQNIGSSEFKAAVGRMINGLISNFTRCGVRDCDKFRPQ